MSVPTAFDDEPRDLPPAIEAIEAEARSMGFQLSSDRRTGALLRALAASKPGGDLLELGTGAGVGTSWILHGMDAGSRLVTVDFDTKVSAVPRRHLAPDPRVTFIDRDAAEFLRSASPGSFDLNFADAPPGKIVDLDLALDLLRPGGIYVVDDLLPQPSWPAGHGSLVADFLDRLALRRDLVTCSSGWSTGLLIGVKTG